MNRKPRERLMKAYEILKEVLFEEQEKMDNCPDGLECSPIFEEIELAIDILEDVTASLEEIEGVGW